MKYCCSFLLLLLLGISGGFAQDKVECWGRYEISLPAKVKGNPFDIELTATFSGPDTTLTVRGFYDGNDTFKIRFMPVSQGVWSSVTGPMRKASSSLFFPPTSAFRTGSVRTAAM